MASEGFINTIINENCLSGLKQIPDGVIDCCVTSPPYFGLRDYGNDEQIGLEKTPELFIQQLVKVFDEVKRVLKTTGTLWLNIGDSYAGSGRGCNDYTAEQRETLTKSHHQVGNSKQAFTSELIKPKDLIGIPWMLAFALRSNGWYLRQDIIWNKPNPMPESVGDRCTKAHEYIFLMTKNAKYYYNADAIKTKMDCSEHDKRSRQGRKRFPTELINGIRGNTPDKVYEWANKRSVWTVTTKPYSEAHFATFPEDLIVDCIKAGCPEGGIVLDPFMGAGTTAVVSKKLGRNYTGFELNPDYLKIANDRLYSEIGMFLNL